MLFQKVIFGNIVNKTIYGNIVNMMFKITPCYITLLKTNTAGSKFYDETMDAQGNLITAILRIRAVVSDYS